MKKLLFTAVGILMAFPVWADVNLEPLLNRVNLPLHAEQWITTKTALVSVGVNAAVTDQGIDKVQSEIMKKLSQLSSQGEWHIVSFDRQQDKTGLETIQILAEARLPQTDLADLRNKAKSISKPGETFTIDNVQFVPSQDEIRQANIALRSNIYQQIKAEIDTLNKTYPDQKYYVHTIDFLMGAAPMPMRNMMMAKAVSAPESAPPLSVGNRQELQAMVVLASMPDQIAQKVAH